MEKLSPVLTSNGIFRGVGLQVFLSFAVSLAAFADGLMDGWVAEKVSQLTLTSSLTQASLIGTIAYYTNILILPVAVFSANYIGRKWTVLWGVFFIFLSWTILFFWEKIEYIYLGVALEGFGMFVVYTINEVYIAEIVQDDIRGLLCSGVPVLVNLGVLSSYICTSYITLQQLTIIGMVTAGLVFPLFVWAPKSPHFLVLRNKPIEARNTLIKLRNTTDIDDELNDIKTVIERNNYQKSSLTEFFTDETNKKVLVIVIGVQVIQQFSGIDTIMIFIEVIFRSSNSVLSNDICVIIFGTCKCIFCVVSLILLDRVGRKPLLIISCSISAISLFFMGLYFFLQEVTAYNISSWSWAPLAIIILYIFGYSIGLGTVTYILASEMFPTKFNALGTAVTQVVYVVLVILVTEICATLRDHIGFFLAFWFLSIMSSLGLIFIVYKFRETKGKSLRQILDDLNGNETTYQYSSCLQQA